MNPLPRKILCDLVGQYGPSVADDPRRLKSLLLDLCGAHRREILLLANAAKEQVAKDLQGRSKSLPRQLLLQNLTKRLEDHLAVTEKAAKWTVESWALALGVISHQDLESNERESEIRIPPVPEASPAHSPVIPLPVGGKPKRKWWVVGVVLASLILSLGGLLLLKPEFFKAPYQSVKEGGSSGLSQENPSVKIPQPRSETNQSAISSSPVVALEKPPLPIALPSASSDQKITETIERFFRFVQEKNIEQAIAMYAKAKRPHINKATLSATAQDTDYYSIEKCNILQANSENARVQVFLKHKKLRKPLEYWEVTMDLINEEGNWKILETPGKRINFPTSSTKIPSGSNLSGKFIDDSLEVDINGIDGFTFGKKVNPTKKGYKTTFSGKNDKLKFNFYYTDDFMREIYTENDVLIRYSINSKEKNQKLIDYLSTKYGKPTYFKDGDDKLSTKQTSDAYELANK